MMNSFLVALDDSPRAPLVFRAASDLADKLDASIHLFRAVSIPPEIPPSAHAEADHLSAMVERKVVYDLLAIAGRSKRVTVARPVVATGEATWRSILDAADRIGADLIVLGSHGYGGLDRVLGTTAGNVANRARCSVLIVREASSP